MLRSSAAIPMMGSSAGWLGTGARPTHATNDRLMLRGLRTASSGWLGKTIMAGAVRVLVVSLAIWGIGDLFRRFGPRALAPGRRPQIFLAHLRPPFHHPLPAPR